MSALRRTTDVLRLLQRFSIGKGDADDLLALAKTIQIISQIVDMTTGPLSIQTNSSSTTSSLRALIGRLDLAGPLKLADRILEAIDEDGLSQQHLAEEAEAVGVAELAEQIAEAEEPQTRSTKRNTIVLKWTPQLGHFCQVRGKDVRADIPDARNVSSTKNTRAFYLPDWSHLGSRLEDAKMRIRTEEQRVLNVLRKRT
ncbi:unnamed protein product [Aureobasidium pullulans]|nr:unnamed protein product [Aureobasidium pullulans]